MRSAIALVMGAGVVLGCSGEDTPSSWSPGVEPSGSGQTPVDVSGNPIPGTSQGNTTPVPGSTAGPGVTGGGGTESTAAPVPGQAPAPKFNFTGAPLYARAVQLTNDQWANSVRDILRLPEPPTQANSFLRAVGGFTTFTNNERVLEVSNDMRESYQLAATEVANSVGTDANIQRIAAGGDAQTFITTLGLRAYRRPLTADEVSRYATLFSTGESLAGEGTNFTKGAKLVVEAMIQSPHFLYRMELGQAGQPLNGYEVAAKLSLWLSGTTPDDALLERAARGELDTPDGVASVAQGMLEGEAATEIFTNMHAELFKFGRYKEIVKFTEEYDPATNDELDQASRLFFARVYEEGLGLPEILTSSRGYVGPAMAKLYGLPAPQSGQLELMDLGPERRGFFSQVPYLALFGDDTHSDAIHRGIFINYQVLCADLPKPGDAVPLPPQPMAGQSDRVRIEKHTGKGTCGEACHGNYINPLGYAFENFDGLGRLRTMDAGNPVDTASAYPFADGLRTFNDSSELMDIILESDEAHECYAKNLASYALQRDIIVEDQTTVEQLAAVSKSSVGSLKSMIVALVESPAFRVRSSGSTL